MHELQFNHPGGFPLDTDTLKKMQEAWNVLGLLAKGFGDNVILSGVEFSQNGSLNMVSDGVVVLNGEVLPLVGGFAPLLNQHIKVFETTENIILKTGESVVFRKKRVAKLSPEGMPISDFTRIKNLAQINSLVDNKVDKVEGKELTTNDLTDDLKGQLQVAYDNAPKIHLLVDADGTVLENRGSVKNIKVIYLGDGGYNISLLNQSDIPEHSNVLLKASYQTNNGDWGYDSIPYRTIRVDFNDIDNQFRILVWW